MSLKGRRLFGEINQGIGEMVYIEKINLFKKLLLSSNKIKETNDSKKGKSVWKLTDNKATKKSQDIIYGPYSQDLNFIGLYKIEYIILSTGFVNKEKMKDSILKLDVIGIRRKYIPLYDNKSMLLIDAEGLVESRKMTDSFCILSSRIIKYEELSKEKFNKFSLF